MELCHFVDCCWIFWHNGAQHSHECLNCDEDEIKCSLSFNLVQNIIHSLKWELSPQSWYPLWCMQLCDWVVCQIPQSGCEGLKVIPTRATVIQYEKADYRTNSVLVPPSQLCYRFDWWKPLMVSHCLLLSIVLLMVSVLVTLTTWFLAPIFRKNT